MSPIFSTTGLALVCASIVLTVSASDQNQHRHSPYAGQEAQEIKSLSPKEMDEYLTGAGMGLAKAAELNHYPGPRHVIELENRLQLSTEQLTRIKAVHDKMSKRAVELGEQIVRKEEALDKLFSTRQISTVQLEALTSEIAALQGSLRATHLQAHLETAEILTRLQIERYSQLRGYDFGH
ncbi:MAG: periplasmic heavy metal sensor [candidate division Zixibacteria bacterium]|nr:periplasmic heavy metal sensor [candidate division Zixibacteria bacterium]